jgi:hypothetical protein
VTNEPFCVTNDMNMQSAIDPLFRRPRPPAIRWTIASLAFVLGLIFYCELCSFVYGERAVGLRVSAVWALQAGLGWIIVGGALGAYGRRIAESAIVAARPRAMAVVAVLAAAAFTIACEGFLVWLLGDPRLAGARD